MFRIEIDHEWQLEKTQATLLRKFPWEFQRQCVDAQHTANFSSKKEGCSLFWRQRVLQHMFIGQDGLDIEFILW